MRKYLSNFKYDLLAIEACLKRFDFKSLEFSLWTYRFLCVLKVELILALCIGKNKQKGNTLRVRSPPWKAILENNENGRCSPRP